MHTVKYFMWGFQPHFAISVKVSVETLFGKIDASFAPNVFLVGLLAEPSETDYPVTLEPEDCGYRIEDFSNLAQLAAQLSDADPNNRIFQSHPVAEQNHRLGIKNRGIKDAIESKCKARDLHREMVTHVSWPVRVEKYHVCVVLQLQRSVCEKYYRLNNNWDRNRRWRLHTSLIDAAADVLLEECTNSLRQPEPGSSMRVIDRDSDELMRAAGKKLAYTPANTGGQIIGMHGFFNACNIISSLKYEGIENSGRMIVARRHHPNVEEVITLLTPVPMSDPRAVRKMLEICTADLMLITNAVNVYAIGRQIGEYDPTSEDLFEIRLAEHYNWELLHDHHSLMRVSYGQPDVPRAKINKAHFTSSLDRIVGDIDQKRAERMWHLVITATQQRHGTMVVITKDARDEAHRLRTQGILIEPTILTTNTIKMVTAIDGAVLVDQEAVCYGIGIILDGIATEKGNPSRGARYNSAIRYVAQKPGTLAIVISADGSVDLIPKLLPQVDQNNLIRRIAELREFVTKAEIKQKNYHETMGWLQEHRFYLSQDMCTEINHLRKECDSLLIQLDPMAPQIVYQDFHPDPDMNDSYFTKHPGKMA